MHWPLKRTVDRKHESSVCTSKTILRKINEKKVVRRTECRAERNFSPFGIFARHEVNCLCKRDHNVFTDDQRQQKITKTDSNERSNSKQINNSHKSKFNRLNSAEHVTKYHFCIHANRSISFAQISASTRPLSMFSLCQNMTSNVCTNCWPH